MNTTKHIILIVSLTLNAFLLYRLVATPETPAADHPIAPEPGSALEEARVPVESDSRAREVLPSDDAEPDTSPDHLKAAESLEGMIAQLEELGVARDLIKKIVAAEIDREYDEHRGLSAPVPYWQLDRGSLSEETLDSIRIKREKRARVLQLFGEDARDDPAFASLFRPLDDNLEFLDSDRQIAIDEIMARNMAEMADRRGPGFIREFREDRRQLTDSMHEAIRSLLTPEEYFEYELRESRTARMMVNLMDGFDYGEQEFRDLFELRRQYDDQLMSLANDRARGRREQVQDTIDQREQAIREYLGEERYAVLQRVQDPMFRSLQAIGERYGNTDAEVVEVYELSNDIQDRLTSVRNDSTLTLEQRRATSAEINTEFLERATDIVGEDAAQSIRNNTARFNISRRDRRPRF